MTCAWVTPACRAIRVLSGDPKSWCLAARLNVATSVRADLQIGARSGRLYVVRTDAAREVHDTQQWVSIRDARQRDLHESGIDPLISGFLFAPIDRMCKRSNNHRQDEND